MNFKSISFALGFGVLLVSCDQYRTQVTDSGLKYQIHEHKSGTKQVQQGEIVSFHLVLKNSDDSVLNDTYKQNNPIRMMYQKPEFKASFEEGLGMLYVGDSATFYVNADSLFAKMHQPLPPAIKKGSDLVFRVRILDSQTPEEFQKSRAEDMVKQKEVDDKVIQDYLSKNNLSDKARKSESGLYYILTKEGTGVSPTAGDAVSVHYEGKFLDGKVFDSSTNSHQGAEVKPFQFNVGTGMVIPGWDEGIMAMKKGEKGTLLIPSGMAYGPDGSPGGIPANAVLLFDVELVDFTKPASAGK